MKVIVEISWARKAVERGREASRRAQILQNERLPIQAMAAEVMPRQEGTGTQQTLTCPRSARIVAPCGLQIMFVRQSLGGGPLTSVIFRSHLQ